MGNCTRGGFYFQLVSILGGVHLPIQTFLKLKMHHFVNIEHQPVCKKYEVKIKMLQEQWLQLKIKSLLAFFMNEQISG